MDRIKHLLNLKEQRIVILGGLMGAGKSTLAKEFENASYVIICPDTERFLLAKQEHGHDKLEGELHHLFLNYDKDAWKNAKEKTIEALKKGQSVLFDATMTYPKARKQVLDWLAGINVKKVAVYVDTPVEVAIERNEKRGKTLTGMKNGAKIYGRSVPKSAIIQKNRNQTLPMLEEGFDEVVYISNELQMRPIQSFPFDVESFILWCQDIGVEQTVTRMKDAGSLQKVFPHLDRCWGVSQENIHHNRPLQDHMMKAADIIIEEYGDKVDFETLVLLVVATLNHDVGKFDTKEFFGKMKEKVEKFEEGEKVLILEKKEKDVFIQKRNGSNYKLHVSYDSIELDQNAHYYDHEYIGAMKVRRNMLELGLTEEFANEVYALIVHHMELPYKLESDRTMQKFINKVGKHRVENLLRIRYADKMSSNTNPDFDEVQELMTVQLKELIEKDGQKYVNEKRT